MSHARLRQAARAVRRAAAAPEREHRPAARRACSTRWRRSGPIRSASIRRTRAYVEACARHFGVDPSIAAGADQRPRRRHHGGRDHVPAARRRRRRPRRRSCRSRRSRSSSSTPSIVGGRAVRVAPRPDFAFPLDEVLAAITARTRIVFVTNPNNPTGTSTAIEDVRTIARPLPPGGIVFVDEAYADFARADLHPAARIGSQRDRRPDVRQGVRPGRAAPRRSGRRARNCSTRFGRRSASTASTSRRSSASRRRSRMPRSSRTTSVRSRNRRRWSTRHATGSASTTGGATPTSFSSASDRAHRRVVAEAAARGIYLRDRSNEPGCAGCIRITTGIVEHTRKGLAVLEEVLCVAR